MNRIAYTTKQPAESIRHSVSYAAWLSTAETVVSATANVATVAQVDPDAVDPNPLTVRDILPDATGKVVTFFLDDGTDGFVYKVTITATTSATQVQETELEVEVTER